MPRFYEEAAHLLFVIVAHGVALAPGQDHGYILRHVAMLLERFIEERPTHANAALHLLDGLASKQLASFSPGQRTRLVALTGTLIGNIMTVHRPKA